MLCICSLNAMFLSPLFFKKHIGIATKCLFYFAYLDTISFFILKKDIVSKY